MLEAHFLACSSPVMLIILAPQYGDYLQKRFIFIFLTMNIHWRIHKDDVVCHSRVCELRAWYLIRWYLEVVELLGDGA